MNEKFNNLFSVNDSEKQNAVKTFNDILPDNDEVKKLQGELKVVNEKYHSQNVDAEEKERSGQRSKEINVELWNLAQKQKIKDDEKSVEDVLKENPDSVAEIK